MGGALFAALLGWIAGAALQLAQGALWSPWAYGGVAAAGLLSAVVAAKAALSRRSLRSLRPGRGRDGGEEAGATGAGVAAGMACAAALALGFAQVGLRAVAFEHTAWPAALARADLWVTGVVDELPQAVEADVEPGASADQRFVLAVEQGAWADSGPSPGRSPRDPEGGSDGAAQDRLEPGRVLPPRILLNWYGSRVAGAPSWEQQAQTQAPAGLALMPQRVRVGERWRLPVRLRAPHGSLNPHGFDYELWLWSRGIQATGYVRAAAGLPAPARLGQTWHAPVEQWRQWTRERLQAQLAARGQSPALAGILSALVLGDQTAIGTADWRTFRDTGIAHLVAVSGLHITLFAWLAIWGIRWLWRRVPGLSTRVSAPMAAWTGGVALAAGYALFCGWGVPAQRTVLMLALVAVLRLSGLNWPLPMVWLAAMAAIVAADPWALLQAGFWLSFVAVGVLLGSGPRPSAWNALERGAAPPMADRRASAGRRLLFQIRTMLREQWVLSLALAPLSLLLFQQVSVVGLLVNLVAIPLVTFVILPLALLGVALPVLWNVDAWLLERLMAGLIWCASWPAAIWGAAARPVALAWLAVVASVIAAFPGPWRWKTVLLPCVLPFVLWRWDAPKQGEFDVTALDVGQGQAVLVRTAAHALLFDAGPVYGSRGGVMADAGERVIVPYLRARGVVLDRLLLSHADSDHIGGAQAVLASQPGADWVGSVPAVHPLWLLRPGQPCVAGQHWIWDEVDFRVLHPFEAEGAAGVPANARSCVLWVGNGAQSVLLAGDIGAAQERALLARWPPGLGRQVSGLFMPHHGSSSSSSEALLDSLRPTWAVAQAGYGNRYGHPHPDVVRRYRRHGVMVFDSPSCGAWRWQSQRPEAFGCERVEAGRYWHHRPEPG